MNGAFYVGGVGLSAQQNALDVIANNITNLNTRAFKRTDVRFSEIMNTRQGPQNAANSLTDTSSVAGTMVSMSTMTDLQGQIEQTGISMDIAIEGRGFIELMGPGGDTFLWRGGRLQLDNQGMLSSEQGLTLKALIAIPDDVTELLINSDGLVSGTSGGNVDETLGQITLVNTPNSEGLERMGDGLYRVKEFTKLRDTTPGQDGSGFLQQGAVERSNVDLNREMIQMMIVQRAYAANAQIVQAADQLMSIANSLRR